MLHLPLDYDHSRILKIIAETDSEDLTSPDDSDGTLSHFENLMDNLDRKMFLRFMYHAMESYAEAFSVASEQISQGPKERKPLLKMETAHKARKVM